MSRCQRPMSTMAYRLVLLFAVLSALLPCRSVAQQLPSTAVGVDPTVTYSSTDLDSVDPRTGRLNLHIPLLTDHSQRGNLNFSYSIAWSGFSDWFEYCNDPSACNWTPTQYLIGEAPIGPALIMDGALGGLTSGDFVSSGLPCLTVMEAGVAQHPVQGATGGGVSACPFADTFSLESVDGSGIHVLYSATGAVLTNSSGIQFQYDGATSSIEDPNGNVMTTTDGSDFSIELFTEDPFTGGTGTLSTMTDTLGRPWVFDYSTETFDRCPDGTVVAYVWHTPGVAGVNGGDRPFTFCYSDLTFATAFPASFEIDPDVSQFTQTAPILAQAILPDGTSYQFHYDDGYGDLTELDLPTGGKITYAYTTIYDLCNGDASVLRTITSRTVYPTSGSPQVTTYDLNGRQMTVTNPLGGTTVYSTSTGYCSPITSVASSDKDGTLLKTVSSTYTSFADPFSWNGLLQIPVSTTTTLGASGPSSTVTKDLDYMNDFAEPTGYDYSFDTSYTSPYGQTLNTSQYDYNGSLISSASTSYKWQSDSYYLAANILTAPYQTSVQGAGYSECSSTTYTYDESAYMTPSGIGPTQQHMSPPNPLALGNITTIYQDSYSPACQSATSSNYPLTSHRFVYDTGMLEESKDPAGNTTTYGYSSTYVGAYPTTVTNALGQAASYTYDFNTGLATAGVDPNGQQTAYSYDNMLRPVAINYPDGGQQAWAATYSGNAYVGSTSTKKINASETYSATTQTDGLGRTTLVTVADPQGADSIQTTYDAVGRVSSVSNPYRTTIGGTTSYAYDVLGRMRQQTNPDGTHKKWFYSGNKTDIYDESGIHTQQTSDAAGRITKLLEADDGGALDVETDYAYDGLNNLISVAQSGISGETARAPRTFTYDTLSRLVSAVNPESGTTAYSYNLSGGGLCAGSLSNPCSRTDARGTVTTYGYDGLNRMTSKSYSDGTPSVSLMYDTPSAYAYAANNGGNFVGRESQVSTSVGDTVVTSKYISGYDPMGRETGYIECGYAGDCASGTAESAFSADYYYDLAGNVITLNTGIGQLGELYPENSDQTQYRYFSYDSVGRLATAEANTDLSPGSQSYQVTNYNAFGKTTAADFPDESGTPEVNIARVYDNRMRLYFEDDTGPYFGLYAYGLSLQGNNDVEAVNDSVMGNWTASYDTKNRMTSMTVYTAGPYYGLTLGWTYDSFGNRLTQTPSGTYTGSVPAAQSLHFNANNQITSGLTSIAYDAAGNVTNDGTNQYHYDAEGRICAVYQYTGSGAITAYVYDGDGNRVAKEALTSFTCDSTTNGFTFSSAYIVGLNGEQLDEADASGHEVHSNTFANGQLLYTYDDVTSEWTVALNDWLGTKRVQVDPAVLANVASFQSLPFGDGLTPNGYDATEQHFTGKERDQESGNDYFGARYYSSNMGRFTSPDPGWFLAADSANPQSWNMYSYALGNPLSLIDPTGMCPSGGQGIAPIINGPIDSESPDNSSSQDSSPSSSQDCPITLSTTESVTVTGGYTRPDLTAPDFKVSRIGFPWVSTASTAPNNGLLTPKQQQCAGAALKKNAVALSFDAAGIGAGFLPGGDLVVAGAQGAVSVASGINSAAHGDASGATLGVLGLPASFAGASAKFFGVGAKAIPGVGTAISALGLLNDAYSTYQNYQTCLAGH